MEEDIINDYFPELDCFNYPFNIDCKYGILNVGLVKNNKVITGHQWNYSYFDGEKLRYLHSYDLTLLRQRVLDLGHDWIIMDNRLAIDAYKLNNKFLKQHEEYLKKHKWNRKYRGSSGVQYVSRQMDKRCNKLYWRYMDENICISKTSLSELKDKVLELNGKWIIRDNRLYMENLRKEKVENGLFNKRV